MTEYPKTGTCPTLGKVETEKRFYKPIPGGKEDAIVFGESIQGPIPAKRKALVSCPIKKEGDGIFACNDCGLYVAKRRLNPGNP